MRRSDHNGPQWLEVRWLEVVGHARSQTEGWYVVRVCPCHFCVPVTLPYPDRERAEKVRRLLLGEITGPTGPQLEWSERTRLTPPPAIGQIWRGWGSRRYMRIEDFGDDPTRLILRRVIRTVHGWVNPPDAPRVPALRRRLSHHGGYLFVEGP